MRRPKRADDAKTHPKRKQGRGKAPDQTAKCRIIGSDGVIGHADVDDEQGNRDRENGV